VPDIAQCLHLFLSRAMQIFDADGIQSARLWSILPVSNNIAELPGLAHGPLANNNNANIDIEPKNVKLTHRCLLLPQ